MTTGNNNNALAPTGNNTVPTTTRNNNGRLSSYWESLLGQQTSGNIAKTWINKNPKISKYIHNKFFDSSHIFFLAGHGTDSGGPRYKLKENEFYASPTTCGRLGIGFDSQKEIFASSNPFIKIPNVKNSSSLYPLNYNYFPFRTTASVKYKPGIKKIIGSPELTNIKFASNDWKVYFPQSDFIKTNSIPSFEYTCFSYQSAYKPIKVDYRDEPFQFEFNGETIIIKPGQYELYYLSISGAISPNSMVGTKGDVYMDRFNELYETSHLIIDKFSKYNPNISEQYGSLWVIVPISEPNLALYMDNNPIANYFREVVRLMFSLSFINFENYIKITRTTTFIDVLNTSIDSTTLFHDIRQKLGDEKPMFILNKLCRGITLTTELVSMGFIHFLSDTLMSRFLGDTAGTLASAAIGIHFGSILANKKAEKEAYESNNEANERSFAPFSNRKKARNSRKLNQTMKKKNKIKHAIERFGLAPIFR